MKIDLQRQTFNKPVYLKRTTVRDIFKFSIPPLEQNRNKNCTCCTPTQNPITVWLFSHFQAVIPLSPDLSRVQIYSYTSIKS